MGGFDTRPKEHEFLSRDAIELDELNELVENFHNYESPEEELEYWINKYMAYLEGEIVYTFYDFGVPNFQRKFQFEKNLEGNLDKKKIIKRFFG